MHGWKSSEKGIRYCGIIRNIYLVFVLSGKELLNLLEFLRWCGCECLLLCWWGKFWTRLRGWDWLSGELHLVIRGWELWVSLLTFGGWERGAGGWSMANGQCFNQACLCNEAFSQELVLGSLGFSRCCGTDSNIRLPWQFSDFRTNSKKQDPF